MTIARHATQRAAVMETGLYSRRVPIGRSDVFYCRCDAPLSEPLDTHVRPTRVN